MSRYYKQLIFTAFILAFAVCLPDLIAGLFGAYLTDLPSWVKAIDVLYILGITIFILYRVGIQNRDLKDPDQTKGYPYGTAFGFMMLIVIASSLPVAALMHVLRTYICVKVEAVSFYGLWSSLLISMLFLGGMGALISAVYVKRNAKK